MTPNQLMVQFAVLVEEVAPPRYDKRSGNDQPISVEEWDALNERWRMLYLLNRPKGGRDGRAIQGYEDGFPY
jgi:hypothetical protein